MYLPIYKHSFEKTLFWKAYRCQQQLQNSIQRTAQFYIHFCLEKNTAELLNLTDTSVAQGL